ncbi:hypothetical protein EMIT0194MI4_70087 [Pseudomonas sp. IT-194MI4]
MLMIAPVFCVGTIKQISLNPLCKRPSALASVPELVRPDNFLFVSAGFPKETCGLRASQCDGFWGLEDEEVSVDAAGRRHGIGCSQRGAGRCHR